jgi:hypothetical protein
MEITVCGWCGKEVTDKAFPPGSKEAQPFCHNCDSYVPTKTEEIHSKWNLDAIQFPRLLDELAAIGVPQLLKEGEWDALEESMDLPRERIMELFGRASTAWQNIKNGVLRNIDADSELTGHDRAEVERCRKEVYAEEYEKLKEKLKAYEDPDPDHFHDEQKPFEEKFDQMIKAVIEGRWDDANRLGEFLGKMRSAFSAFIGSIVLKYKSKIKALPLRLKEGQSDNDLLWNNEDGGIWIEIDNLVVYVRRADDGVAVDITPVVCAEETLDCCSARFEDAKDYECEKCGRYTGGIDEEFCEECEEQPCGHPKSDIVSGDEGTSYCGMCEKEAKDGGTTEIQQSG